MDGLDTYRAILELHPEQKAIIASGYSETDRMKEVQDLGAGAYIKKPFLMEKIGFAFKEELAKSRFLTFNPISGLYIEQVIDLREHSARSICQPCTILVRMVLKLMQELISRGRISRTSTNPHILCLAKHHQLGILGYTPNIENHTSCF